ncbi:MAG: hypothetical protein C7B45_05550 [Sulfobacillus acidophilus]|uniref:Uncharacterized protein n=1 Tax=Sulfobacillus acidophilus TaxID=53633 RepID=A0A2T2WKM8_9FIRM|nr:MAG: hypothetical protein C7B45_05550 [Sulfobacillus acidophilus]
MEVNRSLTTGKNIAWIPQGIMGRVCVRPVADVDANNSRRVEYWTLHATEQAHDRITHGVHDTRPILCAHWGAVFITDHIVNPMEAGLDTPMPANEVPDRCRIGLYHNL